jgi:hypothetical protein
MARNRSPSIVAAPREAAAEEEGVATVEVVVVATAPAGVEGPAPMRKMSLPRRYTGMPGAVDPTASWKGL